MEREDGVASLWVPGKVAGRKMWTDTLVSLQVAADIEDFEAGQFAKLGLAVDGEVVARPYSLVNPPHARPLDFCFTIVPGGPLSPRLAALAPGDDILVTPRANGFLVLREVPEAAHLWLVASGTGIGPFLSILRTATPWQRFERVVLVHAARHRRDLAYFDTVQELVREHREQLRFVPFVSREPADFALPGRIPAAIADCRLETRAGVAISPASSQFMLCGNPQMVDDVTAALLARGLKKHRRRDPGHISVENYW